MDGACGLSAKLWAPVRRSDTHVKDRGALRLTTNPAHVALFPLRRRCELLPQVVTVRFRESYRCRWKKPANSAFEVEIAEHDDTGDRRHIGRGGAYDAKDGDQDLTRHAHVRPAYRGRKASG